MARFSLTQKTLLFVVLTLVVIITLRVGSARLIILNEFVDLETELTHRDMERLLAAMDRECQAMARVAGDWGVWTDSLEYLQGANPDYETDNLSVETFDTLDLDLLVLADTQGGFHWARSRSADGERMVPLAPGLADTLKGATVLWAHPDAASRVAGLLHLPEGLMLAAASPITDSGGRSPVAGTILMARRVGPAALADLQRDLHMEIAVSPSAAPLAQAHNSKDGHAHIVHGRIVVEEVDEARLRSAVAIANLAGQPHIELSARMPRQVVAQGRRTIRYFLFWQAISGVAVTLMAILFVRRVIIAPIARLNRQVSAITASSSFSDRLKVTTADEVGEASEAINQMLAALEAANNRQQAAYEALKDTQAQLVQSAKLASIGELAAGVAHELNQPLTVIRGTAQLIQRRLEPEALPEQLKLVEGNTKRMMNIIEHLRAFARQSDEAPAQTQINKVILDGLLLLREQLRVNAIDLTLDLSPDLPAVWCDANQIEQVLLNLMTNAQDAILARKTAEGAEWRGSLQVSTARAARDGNLVEIRVRDNGTGIAADRLDWVFDPFFTTKPVGEGTGLGLSISYGIIQGHKGDLRVETTGPGGTTFVVQLPTAAAPATERTA